LDELSIYESAIDGNLRQPSAIAEVVKPEGDVEGIFPPCAINAVRGTLGQDNEAKMEDGSSRLEGRPEAPLT